VALVKLGYVTNFRKFETAKHMREYLGMGKAMPQITNYARNVNR
jgi:hypothetical protein